MTWIDAARQLYWRGAGLALVATVLAACAAGGMLSREEAIQIALEAARSGQPEMSAAQEEPHNVQAEQMTYGEASERLTGSADVGRGDDPQSPVWLVSMEGLWLDEFPRPTNVPTPAPFHSFAVVIDAHSGAVLMTSASP